MSARLQRWLSSTAAHCGAVLSRRLPAAGEPHDALAEDHQPDNVATRKKGAMCLRSPSANGRASTPAGTEVTRPGSDAPTRSLAWRWSWLGLVVAIVSLVGLPLLLSLATGSMVIPHNDAWAHARIAQVYAETGRIVLVGWNRSSLVGMVAVVGPFGASLAAQHSFVIVCSVVALVTTYLLVVPRCGGPAAVLSACSLGVVPEFGLLSTSFMTDVPALAGALVCLWAGDVALRRNQPAWLWFAILAGFWGTTIREQALAAPAAVLAAGWLAGRPRRAQVVTAAGVLIMAVAATEAWRRVLPSDDAPPGILAEPVPTLILLGRGLFTLALFMVPVAVAVVRPGSWKKVTVWLGAGFPLLLAALLAWMGQSPLLGNYMSLGAAYARASVGAPIFMPRMVWYAVLATSVMGAALLAGHVLHQGLPRDELLLCAGGFVSAGLLLQLALGQPTFSRYFLILVPVGAGLLLSRDGSHRLRVGFVAAVMIWAFGLALTAGTMAYDAARWEAATQLVAKGVAPQEIDAGFEWVGMHAPGVFRDVDIRSLDPDESWYLRHFDGARACYIVSGRSLVDRELLGTHQFATFGIFGASNLYIYRGDCG